MKLLWSLALLLSLCAPALSAPDAGTSPNPSGKASKNATADMQLQQGAVSWQAWSDDLFAKAAQENKLVLLDLEAIWCHWCHVMDEKTYANPEITKILGEHYIAVKVDQDSRPDLSNRYEDYGWPATIIFNAKGEELVKRSGFVNPDDMASLLQKLVKSPVPEEGDVKKTAIVYAENPVLPAALKRELFAKHLDGYDDKYGSWGTFHKFLDCDSVEYCLERAKEGDTRAALMARQTLNAQLNLIDPVWGGVYQYSTDGDWKHQHFEKIMQIQGENLRIYSLGYMRFPDPKFLRAAEDIERYLRTFLMSPEGAFYTSQDADVKRGQHSDRYFGLKDAERRKEGIPRIDKHIYARENGWAINGLVNLYLASGNGKYLAEAVRAANWISKNRALPGGGFSHDASDQGGPYLGDTLFMGRAFLSLYQASGDRSWLKKAEAAARFIDAHFTQGKEATSAGYTTVDASKSGLQKGEPLLDENICLTRFANLLYRYTGEKEYKTMAERGMKYLATPEIARKRRILVAGILLADRELGSVPAHITIVGAKSDPNAKLLLQAANKYPLSYKRVDWYDAKEGPMPNPDTDYPNMPKAAAFVCVNQRCSLPAFNVLDLKTTLDKMTKK